MSTIKRLVLDVLKPHAPGPLDFARTLSEHGNGTRVHLKVEEMDKNTESVTLTLEGEDIPFEAIVQAIKEMGAALHSIDEVEVVGGNPPEKPE